MGARSPQPLVRISAAVSEVFRALSLCAPTAIVCAPAALLPAPTALAQPAASATLSADIPAQPLDQALAAFANQTGLELVYVSGLMHNQKSRAAAAGMTPAAALTRLLHGTGLKFEYLTPHSIRILAATPAARPTLIAAAGSQEVVVTASRRTESVQDVPMTIQVLTGATLAKLNVQTFDDFVGYLPGVTAHGLGPAQNNVYMRGLGTGEAGTQGGQFVASFPNVAVYLDEQSAQLPSRNLDVYAADLERIEVLEGPQGTLFGAGAEAGVLRYITNKPKLDITEGSVEAGGATTAHGGGSYAINAVVNLPVIAGHLAARAVVYDDRRGGYIDNIPGTFYHTSSEYGIAAYNSGVVPRNSPVINNQALVADAFNPVMYKGGRLEALYQFDDDWSVLLAQSYQDMEADGVFTEAATNAFDQPQPELTVQLFNPSYDKDRFENSALTITGRLGPLKLLYAGSYLERNVEQLQDYTAYAHVGVYVDYYQCVYLGSVRAQCFTPSSYWHEALRNTHESHELRLATAEDQRIRGVGGLFYENFTTHDQLDWYYLTAIPYFNPIGPPTDYWSLDGHAVCGCTPGATLVPGGVTSNNPNVRSPGDAFFNDITRSYRQRAAYASLDLELVPRVLTLTVGTRYYSTASSEVGSTVSSYGCNTSVNAAAPNPCINQVFDNLNALDLERSYSGFRSRANLTWKVADDMLLYYTWSQGFRPGIFNRGLGTPSYSPLFDPVPTGGTPYSYQAQAVKHGGWTASYAVAPDTLTNNEVGWKTTWFDHRLQWNGGLYRENWYNAQIGAMDQALIGGAIINGGDYQVDGLETSGQARLGDGLSIDFAAAWNHSELTREAVFRWADGTPINFSTLEDATGRTLSNPAGVLGSPLAGAPPFQGNLRVRYELDLAGYNAFAQLGLVHQSHSLATVDRLGLDAQGNSIYYDLPPFTTYQAALGVERDGRLVQLYGDNLTDTRAELWANYRDYYKAITVNRPRTVGLRVSYSFGGN